MHPGEAPSGRMKLTSRLLRIRCLMMKIRSIVLVGAIWWCGAAALWAGVQPGDAREVVLERLGPPRGRMQIEQREWMVWDRGSVILQDGKVVEAKLVSPEALEVMRDAQAQERAQRAAENRLRQDRLYAEGMERQISILSDPAYYLATAEEQLRIWSAFHTRYPMVDLREILAELREQRSRELDQLAEQQRQAGWMKEIATAETRRAEAEARRAEAERRASEAEDRLRRQRRIIYVRDPPVYPEIPLLPPKPTLPNDGEPRPVQRWTIYDGPVQSERTSGSSSTSRSFHGPL